MSRITMSLLFVLLPISATAQDGDMNLSIEQTARRFDESERFTLFALCLSNYSATRTVTASVAGYEDEVAWYDMAIEELVSVAIEEFDYDPDELLREFERVRAITDIVNILYAVMYSATTESLYIATNNHCDALVYGGVGAAPPYPGLPALE